MYGKLDKRKLMETNENLFVELYPGLRRYCRFLSRNSWDGEDIAQETMLKALQNYGCTKKINAALLNKIAYHHWIDTLRKRKMEIIEDAPESFSLGETELIETVEYLIQQFTPKQAVIFTLKEAFQYKVNEIADILGTTETSVKSILHRAKKRLIKGDSLSADSFWNEEENEQLFDLFYQSLKVQDPTVLVKSIPMIKALENNTQSSGLAAHTIRSKNTLSPSSTFCMAA